MTAADLTADLCAQLLEREGGEELARAIGVAIEAHRREAYGPSPITVWLQSSPGHRFIMAEYDDENGRVRCNLEDVDDDGDEPVAVGYGETHEMAVADALNKLMGGRQ